MAWFSTDSFTDCGSRRDLIVADPKSVALSRRLNAGSSLSKVPSAAPIARSADMSSAGSAIPWRLRIVKISDRADGSMLDPGAR